MEEEVVKKVVNEGMMSAQALFDLLDIPANLDRKQPEIFAALYFPKEKVDIVCKDADFAD